MKAVKKIGSFGRISYFDIFLLLSGELKECEWNVKMLRR